MPLQIRQNIYPESWFYLTGHCYVRSVFVKHHFFIFFFVIVAVVVCLFVVAAVVVAAVYYYYYYYYYLFYCFFNWYKLDCKFFAELCKFFKFQIKC